MYFRFPLKHSQVLGGYVLQCMLHALISLLGVPGGVKRVLVFARMVGFDSGSSIKIL